MPLFCFQSGAFSAFLEKRYLSIEILSKQKDSLKQELGKVDLGIFYIEDDKDITSVLKKSMYR